MFMRIVVPIKQVPETSAVKMDEVTGTMIRDGVEAIINPLDLYAIEIAIQLRETHGGEVIAISMGPPKASSALREAIAMGCDSAVLITDKAFAGSDTWSTSYVLSSAINKLIIEGGPIDLIICGERATDGDTGQVGPGIASFLDLPVASYISKVESVSNGVCNLHRMVEDGYEILQVTLPTLLTVVKEVASPRLPTLRGKQKAKKIDLISWGTGQLNMDAEKLGLNGSPTRVVKIFRPTVARNCEKFIITSEQTIHAAADKVVDYLKAKELI
jgi:electron transfer flavoprotein beta subunit